MLRVVVVWIFLSCLLFFLIVMKFGVLIFIKEIIVFWCLVCVILLFWIFILVRVFFIGLMWWRIRFIVGSCWIMEF